MFLSLIPDTTIAEQIANEILDWIFKGETKRTIFCLGGDNVFWWNICGNEVQIKCGIEENKKQSLQYTCSGSYSPNPKIITVKVKTKLSLELEGTRRYIYCPLLCVVLHELQHYYQDLLLKKERGYSITTYSSYNWEYHKPILPKRLSIDAHDKIKFIVQVLLLPTEIDAYVTSCYLLSKVRGTSFQSELHEELVAICSFLFCNFSNFLTTKDTRKIWGIIKREFENYAVLKFGGTIYDGIFKILARN